MFLKVKAIYLLVTDCWILKEKLTFILFFLFLGGGNLVLVKVGNADSQG